MKHLLKSIILLIAFIAVFAIASWAYVSSKTFIDFQSLLLCSQGKDELVPKMLCQAYLFQFGGKPSEIAELNHGIGIGWVIRARDESDRKKLVEFLLKKGVDINGLDQRSGISALHTAVLENDQSAIELLLHNGANPMIRDRDHKQTPLEFAMELKVKPNQPDRTAIIQLLKNASKS